MSAIKDDGTESFLSTMAENNDRDHDGLSDEKEVSLGTDVNNPDTDGDKLKDGEEYIYGTNPLKADTDEDLYNDYGETRAGSDPLDKDSIPSILGSVTDTKGNHLESVRRKLKGKNTRVSISGVSDAQGFFGVANLNLPENMNANVFFAGTRGHGHRVPTGADGCCVPTIAACGDTGVVFRQPSYVGTRCPCPPPAHLMGLVLSLMV